MSKDLALSEQTSSPHSQQTAQDWLPGAVVLATSTWNEGTAEMLRSHEQAKKVQVGLESAGQAGSNPRARNYKKGTGGKGKPYQ